MRGERGIARVVRLDVVHAFIVNLAHPLLFAVAGLLAVGAVVTAVVAGGRVGRAARVLVVAGTGLLALAAGGPVVAWRSAGRVVVAVDLSPSTRGAEYREPAALRRRLAGLLGDRPYRLAHFADGPIDASDAGSDAGPDGGTAADRTRFDPPDDADAVVLLSDGRFPATPGQVAGPAVFAVVDPNLVAPGDAAVREIEFAGGRATVVAVGPGAGSPGAGSSGPGGSAGTEPRRLVVRDASGADVTSTDLPPGVARIAVDGSGPSADRSLVARVSAGDRWPENDALAADPPRPAVAPRWWVSADRPPPSASPPTDWTPIAPADLPADSAAYLAPSLIVLDGVADDALAPTPREHLTQYARDLGGSLLVLPGIADDPVDPPLADRLPLSFDPPTPQARWVVLADASGSMAEPSAGGPPRWASAVEAVARAAEAIPPADPVNVGRFAAGVAWATQGVPADDLDPRAVAADLLATGPSGPTNLDAALKAVLGAASDPPNLPTRVLLLTDGAATLPEPDAVIGRLRDADVTIDLLALADVPPGSPVARLVAATGGRSLARRDPSAWADAARDLVRAARPDRRRADPAVVTYDPALADPPSALSAGLTGSLVGATRELSAWDRAWLKPGATPLATAFPTTAAPTATGPIAPPPIAAVWRVGAGRVAALAYRPTPGEVAAYADALVAPPDDPRFTARIQGRGGENGAGGETAGSSVMTVDANGNNGESLDGLRLTVGLFAPGTVGRADGPTVRQPLAQIAPGRYEATLPFAREGRLLTLRLAGTSPDADRVIARLSLPGRYAPEFDAIGVDAPALARLADATGGRVIGPADDRPIDLPPRIRLIDLTPSLALAGATLLLLGLVAARRADQPRSSGDSRSVSDGASGKLRNRSATAIVKPGTTSSPSSASASPSTRVGSPGP